MYTYNFTEGYCPECDDARILPKMVTGGRRCDLCDDLAPICKCSSHCSICEHELEVTK